MSFKLVNSIYKKLPFQIQQTLQKIDDVVYSTSIKKRNQLRLGEDNTTDYITYRILLLARKILLNKACNDNCLSGFKTDNILLAINKLLYNIC